MKVVLLSHTPNPEQLIAASANVCYSNKTIDELMTDMTPEKAAALVQKLIDMGHESPLEHVTFTFAIEGVSRVLSHQLVRTRIGIAISQRSQRYISESGSGHTVPPLAQRDKQTQSEYNEYIDAAFENYNSMTQAFTFDMIIDWSKTNWKEFHAKQRDMDAYDAYEWFKKTYPELTKDFKKKAQEDARYLLPNACHTSMVVTMNARALLNFFKLRCCRRAQNEINELAWEMRSLVQSTAPAVFEKSGPSCLFGSCSEGAYTCCSPYLK